MDYTDMENSVQDHEDRLAAIEDLNVSDYQDANDQNISDLQNNSGQLSFPLSQDTTDLLNQQLPVMLTNYGDQGYIGSATLVAGTVTVKSSFISATSFVFLSVSSVGGTQGTLSYVVSAGQVIITSTSATDTSIISYFIIS